MATTVNVRKQNVLDAAAPVTIAYEHPWVVLTDLEPEQAQVSWYGMRSWTETGYKDFKRG